MAASAPGGRSVVGDVCLDRCTIGLCLSKDEAQDVGTVVAVAAVAGAGILGDDVDGYVIAVAAFDHIGA
jgi:hypothetical protein